jgi:hypothetical protein
MAVVVCAIPQGFFSRNDPAMPRSGTIAQEW